ncbi:MAG: adenylate/guanylate cyclase domain-containing protein [Hyphomicrobiales bacterium]
MTRKLTAQRLRLASGLILFAFALTHYLNHSLGLVSVDAMEAFRNVRIAITRSLPGTTILCLALVIHICLALYKIAERRNLKMSGWEAVQLLFGLAIPFLLFRHIIGTRIAHELYGVDDNYHYALWAMWPGEAYIQATLILLVWIHSCIGLHFWLRLKPWYPRLVGVFLGAAVLIPAAAFAGFTVAGRSIRFTSQFKNPFTSEQLATLQAAMSWALWGALIVVSALAIFRIARAVIFRLRRRIKVSYADGAEITTTVGPTLLEISRSFDIPHASVCGGRARCSTCRVRVLEGLDHLDPPGEQEKAVLERVGAGEAIRLACQLNPKDNISIATLLPAQKVRPGDAVDYDKYTWGVEQTVTVMFADLRGFTSLSEERLPFDVVFLLNQYLGQMSAAIEDSGGYVDKFIGDGIMALFGMGTSTQEGARQALRAARAMGGVLDALNRSLAADLPKPLNIGVGLHTGPAILGRVGISARRGATQRITALGDTVNTASRLEAACKELEAQLVVSADTLKAAGIKLDKKYQAMITVKGKSESVEVAKFTRALNAPAPEK